MKQLDPELSRLKQERDFWKRTAEQFKATGVELLDENTRLRMEIEALRRLEAVEWLALALEESAAAKLKDIVGEAWQDKWYDVDRSD